ncbi:MAG TPA: anaerobic sulfatase maturase [Actinomycetota bacterium]|nr:anaerobic sulfatase maturase [Actinomycetota bacterium]
MSVPTNVARDAFHLLAKPTGAVCNLDCTYCFFLSKEALYPGSPFRMTEDTLEAYIEQLIDAHPTPEVTIAWQGGEPTMMGLDFYRRAVELAEKHRKPGQRIQHTMQTNGVLVDEGWAAFFKEHGFLIGISIDGPRAMHDTYRVNKPGSGTFHQVMKGWEALGRHEVDVNVLCTLHAANAGHPLEVYRFFRDDLGARFIQFIPIVERATAETLPLANEGWHERPGRERLLYTQTGSLVTERSITGEAYGRFLVEIFEEWVRRDVGTVFVQMFDVTLGAHVGQYSLCIHSPTCGDALALEHNGDLYSCDHFVEPEYLLGNIHDDRMLDLVASPKQRAFGQDKLDTLPRYCLECPVRFVCNGGCPKDRFIQTPDGEPGLNYLCAGYKLFFGHVDRPMRQMADLLRAGRFADEIMASYAAVDAGRGRSEPCPCDSGRTWEGCHGATATASVDDPM